jgi:hypothetical protein
MDEADLDEEGVDNMTGMEVTKENEQVEIHGYQCEKYKIVTTVEDETTIQHIWTTTDLNMPSIKMPSWGWVTCSTMRSKDSL